MDSSHGNWCMNRQDFIVCVDASSFATGVVIENS